MSIRSLLALQLLLVTSVLWTQQLPVLTVCQTNRITIAISLPPNVKHVFCVLRLTTLPSAQPGQRSQHGDQLRVGGLYSGRGKRSFHLRNRSERFKGPSKLLFLGYRGSFQETKRPGRDVLPAPSTKVQKEWTDNFTCFLLLSVTQTLYIPSIQLCHLDRAVKGKAIQLQAWTGHEGSRRLRIPDFKRIGT